MIESIRVVAIEDDTGRIFCYLNVFNGEAIERFVAESNIPREYANKRIIVFENIKDCFSIKSSWLL